MAKARKALDWKAQIDLSIDPERARKLRESRMPKESDVCTMGGELCSREKGGQISQKSSTRNRVHIGIKGRKKLRPFSFPSVSRGGLF